MAATGGLKPALAQIAAGQTMSEAEAEAAFGVVLAGGASAAQIGGMLLALRARGETVAELTGAARAMRACMLPVAAPPGAIDVCGTGGDGRHSLNVSTAVTFVVAGAGVVVAKHGNRAATSRAGAADVLAALGVRLDPPMARVAAILAEAGCAFLFAPRHHPGLGHAASARGELGTRTLFNLAGPLSNPAGVTRQLTGVFDAAWAAPMAQALDRLGCAHAWVVHGQGLDELSVAGPNDVVELRHGTIRRFSQDPAALGLPRAPLRAVDGGDAAHNAAALLALLRGESAPGLDAYRDTVLLNAAAALVVAERTGDLSAALGMARDSLAHGAALHALNRLRAASELDG